MIQDILHLDQQLLLALNFDGGTWLDTFFWYVSGKATWIPLYIAIAYIIYRRYGLRDMILAMIIIGLSVVLADQICNIFKTYTPKLRPSRTPEIEAFVHTVRGYRGGLYGTVSAHAATTVAIAIFSSLVVEKRWYTICIFAWAALVAYSRIYLGVHFPLDLIFGTVCGLTVGFIMYRLFVYTTKKWRNDSL